MMILRFRDSQEHQDVLRKLKKMRESIEEIEDCLKDATETTSYRETYRDEPRSRYDYDRRY